MHRHRYYPVRTARIRDVSFGEPGLQYTDIYQLCCRCGKPRVRRIEGYWDLPDILPGATQTPQDQPDEAGREDD
jgi:hypothetical protein